MLNGDTRIIAYVGYPTSIFKSPMVDNSWFVKQDVNAVPLGVKADGFARLSRARDLDGHRGLIDEAARAKGCEIQIGLDMMFEQIPAYLGLFDSPIADPSEPRAAAKFGVAPRRQRRFPAMTLHAAARTWVRLRGSLLAPIRPV